MNARMTGFCLAACLLGLVILITGWVLSYWRPSVGTYAADVNRIWFLASDRGEIQLVRQIDGRTADSRGAPPKLGEFHFKDVSGNSVGRQWQASNLTAQITLIDKVPRRFGFALVNERFGFPDDNQPLVTASIFLLVVPYWFGALFVTIPIALCLRRLKRLRRLARVGYCQKCGYDLRATPDRCPECGMVTTAQQIS